MTDTNHLCDLWEHTIAKGFKHDSKSQIGTHVETMDNFH